MKSIKRVLAITLCFVLVLSLAACGFEGKLKGFIDAATYMSDEENVASTIRMTFSTDEKAKSVSFTDYISEFTVVLRSSEDGNNYEMPNVKVVLELVTKTYNGATEMTINWVGPNGKIDQIISMIYSGEDMYLGTGVFKLVETVLEDVMPGMGSMLSPIYEYEYIHIQTSDAGMFAEDSEMDNANISDITNKLTGTMNEVFKSNAARVLTKEFDKALTENKGEYTLKLDTQSLMDIMKAILNLVIENEAEINKFISELGDEMLQGTLPDFEESDSETPSIKEQAKQMLEELNEIKINKDRPDMTLEYKVKATGKGTDKKQTYSIDLYIPPERMEALRESNNKEEDSIVVSDTIKMLRFNISGASSIQTKSIIPPKNKVVTIE